DLARLRLARLSCDRLLAVAAREARHSGERRSGGRAVDHRPPRYGIRAGTGAGVEDARVDSAPDVRGCHPGSHWRPHHREGVGEGHAQERAGEVLRRRHYAQTETARKAEGRQEADEARREGGNSTGSLSSRAQNGHGVRQLTPGYSPGTSWLRVSRNRRSA